jgi:hypothetical protein
MKNVHKNLVGKPEQKRPLGDLCINGKTILKWIAKKQCERVWNIMAYFCEHGNKPLGYNT